MISSAHLIHSSLFNDKRTGSLSFLITSVLNYKCAVEQKPGCLTLKLDSQRFGN